MWSKNEIDVQVCPQMNEKSSWDIRSETRNFGIKCSVGKIEEREKERNILPTGKVFDVSKGETRKPVVCIFITNPALNCDWNYKWVLVISDSQIFKKAEIRF